MTKSTKRKKEKASDFTKPKLKLGKGKKPATNAVDTSFKARSIALPQQSITVANEISVPTTKRKLTLDALLTHLKHYGAGVRKDALQGLQELLGEHPVLIQQNLSRLVNSCVRLISDEDASVRRALHAFLSRLLPRIPKDHLVPHAATLLLFTASAQSHIFLEIRLDAIRLLDLFLELIPEQVVSGFWDNWVGGTRASHGRKLLDGYLSLLNVGTRFSEDEGKGIGASSSMTGQSMQSTTSINLSTAAKTSVLKSLSKFLHHAIERPTQERSVEDDDQTRESFPLWYLSGSFNSQEAFVPFENILSLQRSGRGRSEARLWSGIDEDDFPDHYPLVGINDSQSTGDNVFDVESILVEIGRLTHDEGVSERLDFVDGRLLNSLCRTLHPVLVSMFLDYAPSVFSPAQASPETELELIHALMMITRCLYGRLLRDSSVPYDQKEVTRKDLDAIVIHMSAYFPFGENRMLVSDIKDETTFEEMNLIYCELFSLRSLDYGTSFQEDIYGPATKRRKVGHPKTTVATMTGSGAARQSDRVREYVIRCLSDTNSSPSANNYPLGQSLTAQTYTELLPTLWWLLDRQDNDDISEVLKAVVDHAMKAGSTSGVKPVVTEFVGRLVLLQAELSYKGSFRIGSFISDELQNALRDWCYHLPKVVWELGNKNPAATELILLFILRLLQRRLWLNNAETYTALCTRFVPFFTIQHPTRGELRGPFLRLDKSTGDLEATSGPSNPIRAPTGNLKRLALDVAAVLVSTTSDKTHYSKAPRKNLSRTVRRTEDDRLLAGLGADPVSVMGSSASVAEAQNTLRNAVDKAVSGSPEEAYWLGVSRIRT
ncbi:IPI1 [Sanghuangporus vaninii]